MTEEKTPEEILTRLSVALHAIADILEMYAEDQSNIEARMALHDVLPEAVETLAFLQRGMV